LNLTPSLHKRRLQVDQRNSFPANVRLHEGIIEIKETPAQEKKPTVCSSHPPDRRKSFGPHSLRQNSRPRIKTSLIWPEFLEMLVSKHIEARPPRTTRGQGLILGLKPASPPGKISGRSRGRLVVRHY